MYFNWATLWSNPHRLKTDQCQGWFSYNTSAWTRPSWSRVMSVATLLTLWRSIWLSRLLWRILSWRARSLWLTEGEGVRTNGQEEEEFKFNSMSLLHELNARVAETINILLPINERIHKHQVMCSISVRVSRYHTAQAGDCQQMPEGLHPEAAWSTFSGFPSSGHVSEERQHNSALQLTDNKRITAGHDTHTHTNPPPRHTYTT